jgi:hypothetical protein
MLDSIWVACPMLAVGMSSRDSHAQGKHGTCHPDFFNGLLEMALRLADEFLAMQRFQDSLGHRLPVGQPLTAGGQTFLSSSKFA